MKIVPKLPSQNSSYENMKMAQSASALGAAILGFGIGAKWGLEIDKYALLIIIVGAVIHLYGMYIMQIKNFNKKTQGIAKILWITAWICFIALVLIVLFMLLKN